MRASSAFAIRSPARAPGRAASVLSPAARERFAVDELHDEKVDALVVADVVNGADVRVVERRDRARLPFEPGSALRILGPHRGRILRDVPAEPRVVRAEHLAHAARTDVRVNPIRDRADGRSAALRRPSRQRAPSGMTPWCRRPRERLRPPCEATRHRRTHQRGTRRARWRAAPAQHDTAIRGAASGQSSDRSVLPELSPQPQLRHLPVARHRVARDSGGRIIDDWCAAAFSAPLVGWGGWFLASPAGWMWRHSVVVPTDADDRRTARQACSLKPSTVRPFGLSQASQTAGRRPARNRPNCTRAI